MDLFHSKSNPLPYLGIILRVGVEKNKPAVYVPLELWTLKLLGSRVALLQSLLWPLFHSLHSQGELNGSSSQSRTSSYFFRIASCPVSLRVWPSVPWRPQADTAVALSYVGISWEHRAVRPCFLVYLSRCGFTFCT